MIVRAERHRREVRKRGRMEALTQHVFPRGARRFHVTLFRQHHALFGSKKRVIRVAR